MALGSGTPQGPEYQRSKLRPVPKKSALKNSSVSVTKGLLANLPIKEPIVAKASKKQVRIREEEMKDDEVPVEVDGVNFRPLDPF